MRCTPSGGCNYTDFQVNIQRGEAKSAKAERCNYTDFQDYYLIHNLFQHKKIPKPLWPRDFYFVCACYFTGIGLCNFFFGVFSTLSIASQTIGSITVR